MCRRKDIFIAVAVDIIRFQSYGLQDNVALLVLLHRKGQLTSPLCKTAAMRPYGVAWGWFCCWAVRSPQCLLTTSNLCDSVNPDHATCPCFASQQSWEMTC